MEKSSSKARGLGRIAVVAALGLVSAFAAYGVGYLSKIGPNPLRIQAAHASSISNLPPLSMDNSDIAAVRSIPIKPSEDIRMMAGGNNPMPQYLTPSPFWPNYSANPSGFESGMPESAGSTTNSQPKLSTASELLTVTPQMLVNFFRPGSTNGAGVSVVAPVSFTPAVPAGQDSSATYKSP